FARWFGAALGPATQFTPVSSAPVGMFEWSQVEVGYAFEVSGIDGVEGQSVGDGYCSNHGVVRTSLNFAPSETKCRGHPAEGPGRVGVEWDWVEVGLGLLQPCLTCGSLDIVVGDERTDRQLSQRD